MQFLFDFVGRVIRSVLRLVFFLAVSVLALSLLTAVLVAVVLTALWSLLTGRKPAVFATFTRFRQASRQFQSGAWSRHQGAPFGAATPVDVVDVQAHEVQVRSPRTNLPLEREPKA